MDEPISVAPRKTTALERSQWVERFRASGLTQTEFAKEHHLNVGTFRNWLYRQTSPGASPGSPQFHEVRLEEFTPTDQGSWDLELNLGNQLRVRWRRALSGEELLQLLRELQRSC